jgi:(R,R)-butanediol dehydrogenase/meso-butanediol dehydrogenase/diacetyl reductase
MRALRYHGKEDVRLEEIEEPALQPGTVKIAPAFTGICGSDLSLYYKGPFAPMPTATEPHPISGETLPVVFGHEFSGVVEEVADDVEGVKVGDHVVVEPLMVCGECPACRKGAYNLCEKMGFIGISGRGGGLSEHIVVEKQWVHEIGDLPLDAAALIEPLSVALHAVKQTSAAEGQTAVVGGAGPIGLLTAAVLKAKGLTVIVSELSEARKQIAKDTGVADVVLDPSAEDVAAKVYELTDGAGADVAFECAGVPVVLQTMFDSLGVGGHVEVVAVYTRTVELDITANLTMAEKTLGASIGYAHDHEEAIELARSGKVDLATFISSRIKVEDIVDKGLARLHDHGETEVKILVTM